MSNTDTTAGKGGRKALGPGELGNYAITGHRADGTPTTATAHYYQARAWIGLEHSGRKRVQVRGASKTEVRHLLQARADALAEQDREDGAAGQDGSIPATWAAAVQDHRAHIATPTANRGRGYSEATKRVYLSAIDLYLVERSPFKDDRRLSSIKRGHLEPWLAGIANSQETKGGRRVGGQGVAKTVRSLVQSIYRRAEREDVVQVNPTRGLQFERSPDLLRTDPKVRDHRRAFTEDERAQVFHAADTDKRCRDNDLGDLVRFLIGTGCRIGEALALTWEHVDLEASPATVTVASTASRVAGEGIKLGRTKTDGSARVLELPRSLASVLQERYSRMTVPGHERPLIMGEAHAVFPSSVGTLRDGSNVNEVFRHLYAVAGVPWATTHTCRTTTANVLKDGGWADQRIAAHLGNSVETLARHYFDFRTVREGAGEALEMALFSTPDAEGDAGKVDTEVDTEASGTHLSIVKAS